MPVSVPMRVSMQMPVPVRLSPARPAMSEQLFGLASANHWVQCL
jgi:hypothetical protein